MLHSLKDIMHSRLHVGDRKVTADEVFFDSVERRLRYLAVDIGGWFSVHEVIVSAALLDAPGETGGWGLRIDEPALEAAPRWHDRMADEAVDLTGWPPIIVGPFGGTYAPMLMYEQLVARGRAGADPAGSKSPTEGSGEAMVYRLERVTEWLGLLAFGRDGRTGPDRRHALRRGDAGDRAPRPRERRTSQPSRRRGAAVGSAPHGAPANPCGAGHLGRRTDHRRGA
jgi:hypothetical protein